MRTLYTAIFLRYQGDCCMPVVILTNDLCFKSELDFTKAKKDKKYVLFLLVCDLSQAGFPVKLNHLESAILE